MLPGGLSLWYLAVPEAKGGASAATAHVPHERACNPRAASWPHAAIGHESSLFKLCLWFVCCLGSVFVGGFCPSSCGCGANRLCGYMSGQCLPASASFFALLHSHN